MPKSPLAAIVGRLVRGLPPTDGSADEALLARFVGWRDEAAFELLVYRHGPMVRGLGHRILRHEQDAEDAFQATFLALARKAATVRGKCLAGWLYRVAFHASLKARAKRAPCPLIDVGAPACGSARGFEDMPTQSRGHGTQIHDPAEELQGRELRAALDEEILRLPERFRLPVVLCYMQGRSNSEASRALGIPKGTVDSRLATARQRLRVRLLRRGFAPAVAGAAIEGTLEAVELPGSVARAVTKAAVAFISKQAGVPATAAVLAEGVLQTMYLTKIKWAMATVLALGLLGSGAGVATIGAMASGQPPVATENSKKPVSAEEARLSIARPAGQSGTTEPANAADLRKRLQMPAGLDKPLDNTTLRDALEYLSDKFGMTIRIDPAAFASRGCDKPFELYDQQVRLPVVRGMTVAQVLHDLVAQLRPAENQTSPQITYQVKGSQIVIVPAYMIPFARTLASEEDGPNPPLSPEILEDQVQGESVFLDCKEKSLNSVLHDLADATGANIVLDSRMKDKGDTLVTVTLQNVRLFTALRVLADLADLQPTTIGNVYYVTSKQNADRLFRQEWLKPAPGSAAKPTEPAVGAK